MPQYLRAYAERAADDAKLGDPIRYVASTENVARDGMVIPAEAWQLDNFRNNPVVLFCHDYYSRPPIGKVTNIEVRDGQLLADVVFDSATDEFAAMCEKKVRSGVMPACSVGWDTLSFEPPNGPNVNPRVTKADLLDFSVVPVPSDPSALKRTQARSLSALGHEFLKLADESDDPLYAATRQNAVPPNVSDPVPPARATWPEDAAAMARLFRPFAQRPDSEREQEYRRLARAYARHGKTPPEFLPQTELDALAVDDIRAHFLEGEPELAADVFAGMGSRAGAVLSRKNQDDLEQIVTLAQGILTRARKEADQSDDEHAATESLRQLRALFEKDQKRP